MRPKRDWCSSCACAYIVVPRRLGSPSGTHQPTLSRRVVLAPGLASRDCYSNFCSRRHILQIITLGISITSSPLRSNLLILFVQTLVASTLLQNLNITCVSRARRPKHISSRHLWHRPHCFSFFLRPVHPGHSRISPRSRCVCENHPSTPTPVLLISSSSLDPQRNLKHHRYA